MALQLGDTAPDFEAETTAGRIRFHDWLGDSWGILFSHPKDFTPVCTTELGAMAGLKSEFDRRNVKILGLSVDPVSDHAKWAQDIEDVTGYAPNYPLVGDSDLKVAKLYGMLPADAGNTSQGRTAVTNQTVRSVFVVDPAKKIRLLLTYPMATGRNFQEILRVIDSLQLTDQHQGRDARQLEAGRRRDYRRRPLRRGGKAEVSGRMENAKAVCAGGSAAARLIPTGRSPDRSGATPLLPGRPSPPQASGNCRGVFGR